MVGIKRKTKTKNKREGRYGRFKARKALRMVFVRTPGGGTTTHFKKKKPSKAKCADCGKQLAGTLRELPSKMKKLSKTKKRPTRPYGGNLCSSCMRKKLVKEARAK